MFPARTSALTDKFPSIERPLLSAVSLSATTHVFLTAKLSAFACVAETFVDFTVLELTVVKSATTAVMLLAESAGVESSTADSLSATTFPLLFATNASPATLIYSVAFTFATLTFPAPSMLSSAA